MSGLANQKNIIVYPEKRLENDLIYLEEFTEKHLYDKKYQSWLHDNEVMEMIGRPEYLGSFPFYLVEEYVINRKTSGKDFFFAIYFKEGNVFVGTVRLGIDWINNNADFGIMVGDKKYWNKGILKSCLYILGSFCFNALKLNKMVVGCLSVNIAMKRGCENLGFTKEGIFRKRCMFRGEYVDSVFYGLLKEEFNLEVI